MEKWSMMPRINFLNHILLMYILMIDYFAITSNLISGTCTKLQIILPNNWGNHFVNLC